MKKILFALSLIACAAGATASDDIASKKAVNCVSFAPSGYCDGMQYDSKKKATWVNYDCGGSNGKQTKANYKKGTAFCDGTKGCDPAATYGWDSFTWEFDKKASTGTLKGVTGGTEYVLQQDIPVEITAGACTSLANPGGVSSLAR